MGSLFGTLRPGRLFGFHVRGFLSKFRFSQGEFSQRENCEDRHAGLILRRFRFIFLTTCFFRIAGTPSSPEEFLYLIQFYYFIQVKL